MEEWLEVRETMEEIENGSRRNNIRRRVKKGEKQVIKMSKILLISRIYYKTALGCNMSMVHPNISGIDSPYQEWTPLLSPSASFPSYIEDYTKG